MDADSDSEKEIEYIATTIGHTIEKNLREVVNSFRSEYSIMFELRTSKENLVQISEKLQMQESRRIFEKVLVWRKVSL